MTKITEAVSHPQTSTFVTDMEVRRLVDTMRQLFYSKLEQRLDENNGQIVKMADAIAQKNSE